MTSRHADNYTALLFISAPTPADLRANVAGLFGVLGMKAGGPSIDEQLADVLLGPSPARYRTC